MSTTKRLSEIDARVYSPHKIAAIARELGNRNIPVNAVLAGSSLNPRDIEDPHTRISTRQLIAVCANAVRLSKNDPELAFRVGASMHPSSYALYGYALLCMPNLGDVSRIATHYHRLANPLIEMSWHDNCGDTVWWNFPTTLPESFPPLPNDVHQFMLDMQFVVLTTMHLDIFGPDCLPLKAFVAQNLPQYAELYGKYLRCQVEFGAGRNELHFPIAFLDKRPLFANPMTATIMTDVCDQLLSEMQISSGLVGAVYRELMRTPGCFPSATSVADALHMTTRTLLRKLKAEGTSYRDILGELRRTLAIDYLRNTQLSFEDIAATLGFASAAAFRHAFVRWTGSQPAGYRTPAHYLDPFHVIGRHHPHPGTKQ